MSRTTRQRVLIIVGIVVFVASIGRSLLGQVDFSYQIPTSVPLAKEQQVAVAEPDIDQPCDAEPVKLNDIAVLSGATIISETPTMLTYDTNTTTPDTMEFYAQEMAQDGWQPNPAKLTELERPALAFTKAGQSASILFRPIESQQTRVVVMVDVGGGTL